MAPKLEISTGATHSKEIIASILMDYFPQTKLVEYKYLFGGYSGSNYMVKLDDSSTYVLKITNGYTADHAELMCQTAYYLGETCQYKDCCRPIPKKIIASDKEKSSSPSSSSAEYYKFVSLKEPNQVPAFVLTFIKGKQADKVMRENPNLAETVMKSIGSGLGRMHNAAAASQEGKAVSNSSQANDLGLRWYQTSGGCCDVQDHIDGKILSKIQNYCPTTNKRKTSFMEFYEPELQALLKEMALATTTDEGKVLQHGITHGDPFADNVLVDEKTGLLTAFIDIEDVCVGPLLFDLACCAIGCCFQENHLTQAKTTSSHYYPQVLNFQLFTALMEGYTSERELPQIEIDHFVPYMRVALLCNCSWRFVKFNAVVPTNNNNNNDDDGKGTDDEEEDFPEEAQDSYLELQHRIEYLHDTDIGSRIENILKK